MNTEEILAGLRTAPIDRPPRDLLEAALARQQEVTPGLVQALTQAADNPLKLLGDFDNNLYYWSAYLLAVFREPAAFKPLLKLFQMDEKAAEGLIYEVLDEHIPPLLACTFDGDLAALRGFITAPATDSYLRGEGVVALGILQSWEIINTHVLVQEQQLRIQLTKKRLVMRCLYRRILNMRGMTKSMLRPP